MSNKRQFTLDWPYGWMTADERGVVIYCTDAPGLTPIHGRVDGISISLSWNNKGRIKSFSDDNTLDLVNCPAPTVSVPVDKLRDGTMVESLILARTILIPKEFGIECGSSRPVKWFYADEMEIEK